MPEMVAEYTDPAELVVKFALNHWELADNLPQLPVCYPLNIMLRPRISHGSCQTVCMLLGAALLLACSSDDTPAENGSVAGATNQTGGAPTQATGGSQARGGSSTQGASASVGGATVSIGGATIGAGGAGISSGGTAATSGGAAASASCSHAQLACRMAEPSCPAMEVPEMTANGSCYSGNCISIGSCTCSTAADCPDNNQYTCNVGAKRCTPYLI